MPESSSLHVLLVEDDLAFQETFRRVFALLGGEWKIHAHQSGGAALQGLDEHGHRYELALIDIGLPDTTGVEVIAKLRQRYADLKGALSRTPGMTMIGYVAGKSDFIADILHHHGFTDTELDHIYRANRPPTQTD